MVTMWKTLEYYLEKKWFIISLILINFAGSVYGFIWYKEQILETPIKWLVFVPDSPMASSFFTIFLILYLFKKKVPIIEALASVAMFKYGIWATAIIIWGAWATEPSIVQMVTLNTLNWIDVMLMVSHLAMAFAAILFYKKYNYGFLSIFMVGLWIFANDFIDYTQGVYPWLPKSIDALHQTVGEYTLYLSGFSLLLFYILTFFKRKSE